MDTDSPVPGANPGFALAQLMKAYAALDGATDEPKGMRAQRRIEQWWRVLTGMADGSLSIGSRAPVADVPVWVTTEVAHGGFVTGHLAAEGPLRPYEHVLLTRLGLEADADTARAQLNAHHLTANGYEDLLGALASGRYRLEVPEEAALLSAAWLVDHGDSPAATALLDTLGDWLGRLRFYPAPAAAPIELDAALHVSSVGDARTQLAEMTSTAKVLAMREALLEWLPLYDRLVELFVETLDGPPPALGRAEDGTWARDDRGRLLVEGGEPGRVFPDGWRDRAIAALDDARALSSRARAGRKFSRPGGHFGQLRSALDHAVAGALDDGQRRRVRVALALIAASRGLPDSTKARALRAQQRRDAMLPDRRQLAAVVHRRLTPFEAEEGLEAPTELLAPLTSQELAAFEISEPRPFPEAIRRAVLRCRTGSLDELLASGAVPSSEVLATLIPGLTAAAIARPISDPALRRLYGATYLAFRRRRSVLLLNYAKQVQFRELPWIAALARHTAGTGDVGPAREVLQRLTRAALTTFPHTQLPNPLVRELGTLASAAGLSLPLVEELATDIFMGGFTQKFLASAHLAARWLANSPYARYYGIDYAEVAAMPLGKQGVSEAFSTLCAARAQAARAAGGAYTALNGTVIEQAQILTTHNLAVLIPALGLQELVAERAPELAERCFDEIARMVEAASTAPWRASLHGLKNAAYAWRQMMVFVSLLDAAQAEAFVAWARVRAEAAPAPLARKLDRLVGGLAWAIAPDSSPETAPYRFLGWATGPHPLLAPEETPA